MTDIPIIFSKPMILALLAGRKTMTRRLAWREVELKATSREMPKNAVVDPRSKTLRAQTPSPWQRVKSGDRLWVKETHYRLGHWYRDGRTKTGKQRWRFRAALAVKYKVRFDLDGVPPRMVGKKRTRTIIQWWKRPVIFMPRDLSRLMLGIAATKIERLREISEHDCEREGIYSKVIGVNEGAKTLAGRRVFFNGVEGEDAAEYTARRSFELLWTQINGAESWDTNPDVVALTFAVHQQNIDAMPKEIAA